MKNKMILVKATGKSKVKEVLVEYKSSKKRARTVK